MELKLNIVRFSQSAHFKIFYHFKKLSKLDYKILSKTKLGADTSKILL